jgi:hypothetical protein
MVPQGLSVEYFAKVLESRTVAATFSSVFKNVDLNVMPELINSSAKFENTIV